MPRLDARTPNVSIDLDGETIDAVEGEPVACALLAAGERVFARSVKYHRPRGPFCFAAACSQCMMRVDGVPNVYTCQVPARAGQRLERQNAFPSARFDVFAATDWLFPRGMDHHEMFAGVPVAEQIMAKVARQLAGLGVLPEREAPKRPEAEAVETTVAIVGGGAAGLAAARELTARKVPFLLLEREPYLGGRLATAPVADDDPAVPAVEAFPSASVRLGLAAIGLFDDDNRRFLVAAGRDRVLKVTAQRFLLCNGGHPQLIAFENNDLPGVFAARAVSAMIRRHHYLPGTRFAVVTQNASAGGSTPPDPLRGPATLTALAGREAALLRVLLTRAGAEVVAETAKPLRAHGRTHLTALTFEDAQGKRRKVSCDAVAVAAPAAPSFELARQGGAPAVFDPEHGLFVVKADADGRTQSPTVFVAGELTGPLDAQAADARGRRAAQAIASEVAR